MKKATLFIFLFTLSSLAFAQSNSEEVDMIQSIFGMEKKAFVAELIQVDGVQEEAFWALYDEYETKRKDLGKRRIALLEKYAANYGDLDDATTSEILTEMMKLQSGSDKLIGTYAKKIKKSAGVTAAAQFYQVEGYIVSKIRAEILENIPVIGNI